MVDWRQLLSTARAIASGMTAASSMTWLSCGNALTMPSIVHVVVLRTV